MHCDEKKVKDIIIQISRLYQDLLETKTTIEEKNQVLSSLTIGHIDTTPKDVNNKLEEAVERIRLLITEIETKSNAILAMDNLKGDSINKKLPGVVTGINTAPAKTSRFTMAVSEQEALNAITNNLKRNREITNLVNAEISKGKAVVK